MKRSVESQTYETVESPGTFCIPGFDGSHLTLCGFVDVQYTAHEATEHPCNCKACIQMLEAVQKLRFEPGYFAKGSKR